MIVRRNSFLSGLLLSMVLCTIFSIECSKPIAVNSRWPDNEIIIDGKDEEWGGATIYAAKEKVSLTLINDSTYLYIRLYSRDRDVQMKVLGSGLTIWFDSKGGTNKVFGIRFPLGREKMDMPPMARSGMQNQEDIEKMLEQSIDELEILLPEKEESHRLLLAAAETHGISAKLHFSKGNVIYELKVPLAQNEEHAYAVGIDKSGAEIDSTIGIGFETAKVDVEAMKERMQEEHPEMPSRGSGLPPGGSTPMPPGGGPPGAGSMFEPVKLWLSVKLASKALMKD
jgi:hypothetical protein